MAKNKAPNELLATLQNVTSKQYNKAEARRGAAAVIYTRVSSQEQAENNSSLEIQAKLCQEYARRKGLVVRQSFGGTYESAKTDGRKEFQRMLSYVRKDKEVSCILVYNFDRFSRTGPAAAQLSIELRKLGIAIKSVTQEIDSSTPSGSLQENFFHLFNHYDNQQRASRTATNTREVMLKGYWPYHTPMGYKNLKPKHRACEHVYEITEEGKWLRKAFEWKAEGVLSNVEIVERLKVRGLRLNASNFKWILSNPFYAGFVTGRLVDGQLIEGKHPALVDLKTFLKANDLLAQASNAGIAKVPRKEDLPLKVFVREEQTGSPLTGYKTKGNWYYKARAKGVGVNIRAEALNALFAESLKTFEYDRKYRKVLAEKIEAGLQKRLASALEEAKTLKKRLTELEKQLEEMEERYALGKLKEETFEKFSEKYHREMVEVRAQLAKSDVDSSNLKKAVEKALSIAQNLSGLWVSGDYDVKRKLQQLVFPEGVLYSKKNGAVRTTCVNEVFLEIPLQVRDVAKTKKGNPLLDCLLIDSVHRTGFEPAHLVPNYCWGPPEEGAI
jgi:site-specific DNA recombinase